MSADDLNTDARALSRRRLFATTGLTVSFGAVLAACGGPGEGLPGRVGNAPVPTDAADEPVDDVVLLRTASSLEYTALDVYARLTELGVLDEAGAALVERFVADHTANAATLAELTTQAGGEPFECANPWLAERVVPTMFERLNGVEDVPEGDEPILPSDDPARDSLGIAYGIEASNAATYQELAVKLHDAARRTASVTIAAQTARHAAAAAIARDGAPEAYISPVILGGQVDASANGGLVPIYAVPGNFGSLAPVQITIGPSSDAGTRFGMGLQTPAANSYVYTNLSCQA